MSDRRLTITIQDGYLTAYAHDLDAEGNESRDSYGLQGRPRPQITEGVLQFVAEFLAHPADAEAAAEAEE
jgi:hypothetical protein